MAPKMTVFEQRDENNENLKVHLEYADSSLLLTLPKETVSIYETVFLNLSLRRIRSLPDTRSSTRSNIDEY